MSQPVASMSQQLCREQHSPGTGLCRRLAALGTAVAALSFPLAASAQQYAPAGYQSAGYELASPEPQGQQELGELSFAAGLSLGFLRVQELGDVHRFSFIPSLVGFAYVPVLPRVYLRPGLRLGYSGLQQAQFSHGAGVEEHSLQGTAELGVQYDAWLVPALSVGGGAQRREIDFMGRGIVVDSDAIDRTEWLGLLYAQVGLGLPLWDGLLVIEPYARVQHTFSDARSLLQLGADITIGF